MRGIEYVIKAVMRKRLLAWQLLLIVFLMAIPASIGSTVNYISLYVETSVKALEPEVPKQTSGSVLYTIVNLTKGASRKEATLMCPENLSEVSGILKPEPKLESLSKDEVLISLDLAKELDLSPGEEISLVSGEITFSKVVGYVKEASLTLVGEPGLCELFRGVKQQNSVLNVAARRSFIIREMMEELRNTLDTWLILSSLLLFTASSILMVALIKDFQRELQALHDLGVSRGKIALSLTASSLIVALLGTPLGVFAGAVIAQTVFKVGSVLGLLMGLNPFLRIEDILVALALNSLALTSSSLLAYALQGRSSKIGGV